MMDWFNRYMSTHAQTHHFNLCILSSFVIELLSLFRQYFCVLFIYLIYHLFIYLTLYSSYRWVCEEGFDLSLTLHNLYTYWIGITVY